MTHTTPLSSEATSMTPPVDVPMDDAVSADSEVNGYTIFRVNADRDEAVIVKIPQPAPVLWIPGSYRNGVWSA